MMLSRAILCLVAAIVLAPAAPAQVIEYENNGQRYQTLTRSGLTVIIAHLATHVHDFGLIQVSISNGSQIYWTVRPEDFSYARPEGSVSGLPAKQVVDFLLDRGSNSDVIHLVTTYENALYAIPHMRSTNGYEQRRRSSLSAGMPVRLKAAAAASAIAFAQTRLAPGESTDGAVFIPLSHDLKSLKGGKIIFHSAGETFEFLPDETVKEAK